MSTPKTIDLAEAFQPIPPVRLRDGRLVTVKPFSGLDIELRKRVVADPSDSAGWYALAARALPDLSEQEILELSEPEVVLIATLAAEQYELVNKMIADQGKARALTAAATPAGDGSAPSSSTPATPSATSAPS